MKTDNTEKKSIIFIVGAGRSGSTVLDKFLGAHSQSFSLGEIGLFKTSIQKKIECSCEQDMSRCKLYGPIIDKHNAHSDQFRTEFRLKSGGLIKSMLNYLSITASLIFRRNLLRKDSRDILHRNSEIFRDINDKIDKQLYIDSTKNIIRAILLQRFYLRDFNVHYVFLIRDPRAIVISRQKKEVIVELKGSSKKIITNTEQNTSKAIKSWNFQNTFTFLYLYLFVSKSITSKIKYNTFTENPKVVFESLKAFHRLSFESNMTDLNSTEHHIIGGNYSKINAKQVKNNAINFDELLTKKELKYIVSRTRFVRNLIGYTNT